MMTEKNQMKVTEDMRLSNDELCDLFHISKVTLYRMRRDGVLAYHKKGKAITYDYEAVMLSLRTCRMKVKGMTKLQAIETLQNYKTICEL